MLLVCTVVALVLANSPAADSFLRFWNTKVVDRRLAEPELQRGLQPSESILAFVQSLKISNLEGNLHETLHIIHNCRPGDTCCHRLVLAAVASVRAVGFWSARGSIRFVHIREEWVLVCPRLCRGSILGDTNTK